MQKVLKEEPLPPSTLNVQLPPAIDAVVRKALAKRADDRFQSAQAFATALHAAMPANVPTTRVAGVDPDATLLDAAAVESRESRSTGASAVPIATRACQAIASDRDCGRCRHRGRRPRRIGGHVVVVVARQ